MKGQIVVLGGGPSAEREVSIRSAQAVYEALKDQTTACLEIIDSELPATLDPTRDILFLTTHGTFGEDGQLQAQLDNLGFAYTGADAASSEVCFNKQKTRHLAERAGLKIAEGFVFAGTTCPKEMWKALGPKIVLKPNAQGSSVGLHIVDNFEQLEKILPTLGNTPYLAERFIEGRELTVGLLGNQALAPVEIIADGGVYDYAHKYTKGMTHYECPAKVSDELAERIRADALKIFQASGCRDFARVDFRLSPAGELFFLEVNTLPGMTATSLLPKSAVPFGYDFPKLVSKMLQGARARFVDKNALALA